MSGSSFYFIPRKDDIPISGFPVFITSEGQRIVPLNSINTMFSKYTVLKNDAETCIQDDFIAEYIASNRDRLYPQLPPDISMTTFIDLTTMCGRIRQASVPGAWLIGLTQETADRCSEYILGYTPEQTYQEIEKLYIKSKRDRIISKYITEQKYKDFKAEIHFDYDIYEKNLVDAQLAEFRADVCAQTDLFHREYKSRLDDLDRRQREATVKIEYHTLMRTTTQPIKEDVPEERLSKFPKLY